MSPSRKEDTGDSPTSKKTKKKADDEEQAFHRQKPYQQPRAKEFFALVRDNDVMAALKMVKENRSLVEDVDEERKTPLHWACKHGRFNMAMIMVDFGANLQANDDFMKKPVDDLPTGAESNEIKALYAKADAGTLKRATWKYEDPMYVKYLTPVEKIKELSEFIARV